MQRPIHLIKKSQPSTKVASMGKLDDASRELHLSRIINADPWDSVSINFQLVSKGFPDNKIYGTIKVDPESSRKLIEHFILWVNGYKRKKFHSFYTDISVFGFNISKRDFVVQIEAIPVNSDWVKRRKLSNECDFYFTGEIFSLSPTIRFGSVTENEVRKPKFIVQWFHVGDDEAHRYELYLDDIIIKHIRQKLIEDVVEVEIVGLNFGDTHTIKVVAKRFNGKITYETNLIEFIVRDPDSVTDIDNSEYLGVIDECAPPNLPIVQVTHSKPSLTYGCCNQLPHEFFPGIEHYFNNIDRLRFGYH